jgi:CRP/FNR family transcriptional regulator, cyclic AMP receptor protein
MPMVQIELPQNEMEMLREILKKALSELSLEIAFSDRKEFREFLKKRKAFMEGFIQRLEKELGPEQREVKSLDRLRNVDILQGLTEAELQSIAPFFEEENVPAGAILCEEGVSAERLYVLEQGNVSINSKKGGRYDIDTPGKIVGWSFLVPPFLYTATAVTTTSSKVLVIKSPDFYYVIHKEPKMGMKVINNLSQVIAGRLKRLEGLF